MRAMYVRQVAKWHSGGQSRVGCRTGKDSAVLRHQVKRLLGSCASDSEKNSDGLTMNVGGAFVGVVVLRALL